MPRDPSSSGTVNRLASRAEGGRADRKALRKQSMPGGGEVFTGDLASRSLKAVGARAMTVDRSIVVSDDFDPSKPEDQALFAHEQFHLEHSGGAGTSEHRDAEEVAARSVESMVLHRARHGGAESHEAHHAVPGGSLLSGGDRAGPAGPGGKGKDKEEDESSASQRVYVSLTGTGLSHDDIVAKLAHDAIQSLDYQRDLRLERYADKKGFL